MAKDAIELIKKTEEEASVIIAGAYEKAKGIIDDAEKEKKENKIREQESQKKVYDNAISKAKEDARIKSEESKDIAFKKAEDIKNKLLSKKSDAVKIVIDHVLKG